MMNTRTLTTQLLGLAGYANASPTEGEIRTVNRAIGNGWTAEQLRATAQRCAATTTDNPRAYLLGALRSHATEQPAAATPAPPATRSNRMCPNCNGTGWSLAEPVERFGYSYSMLARCATLHLYRHREDQNALDDEMAGRWASDDTNSATRARHDPDLNERLHHRPLIGHSSRFPPRDCDCTLCHTDTPKETTP